METRNEKRPGQIVVSVCNAAGLTRGEPRISEREFNCVGLPEFLGTGNPRANLEVVAEIIV